VAVATSVWFTRHVAVVIMLFPIFSKIVIIKVTFLSKYLSSYNLYPPHKLARLLPYWSWYRNMKEPKCGGLQRHAVLSCFTKICQLLYNIDVHNWIRGLSNSPYSYIFVGFRAMNSKTDEILSLWWEGLRSEFLSFCSKSVGRLYTHNTSRYMRNLWFLQRSFKSKSSGLWRHVALW